MKAKMHPKTMQALNLKGYIVGNGATNWDIDVSPAYPEVLYNFNIIPQTLLETFQQNDCHFYFNDLKDESKNSQVCNDTWKAIQDLAKNLNEYDLYRKVYPDDGLLAKKTVNGKQPLLQG